MANDKKPSIYYDRGTIGSSDELDEYGVWVKSEPQDLSSPGGDSQEIPDDTDTGSTDIFDEISTDFTDDPLDIAETEESVDIEDPDGLPDMDIPDLDLPPDDDFSNFDALQANETDEIDEPDEAEAVDTGFSLNDSSDMEIPEMDFDDITEETSDESADLGFTEVSLDDLSGEDNTSFNEPASLNEVELAEPSSGAPKAGHGETAASQDLSTQLLMKIANELASIRTELSTLKKDFAGLRSESPAADDSADHGFFNQEEDDEKIALTGDEMDTILNVESDESTEDAEKKGGFFDEEDDETISLTGDELDNILNTADFTEEAGADATDLAVDFAEETEDFNLDDSETGEIKDDLDLDITPEEADAIKDDLNLDITPEEADAIKDNLDLDITPEEADAIKDDLDLDITPEEADAIKDDLDLDITPEETDLNELAGEAALDQAFEDINFDEEPIDPIELDLPDELKQLQEEGVQPMTPAPEPQDTSYLEEDPLSTETFSEESLDLSEAVIDEPDLSGEIQDNPIEEPSLDDISIDLDMGIEDSETPAEGFIEETDEFNLDAGEEIEISLEEEDEIPVSPEETAAEIPADDLALIPEGFVVEADENQPAAEAEGDDLIPDDFAIPGENAEEERIEETIEESIIEETAPVAAADDTPGPGGIPSHLKQELKTVLSYMDQLLESLPDDKIEEFAQSQYFDTYKKLFKELGLV